MMDVLVGKRVRGLRQQKGLSQEAAAVELNMSQSAYARMERGESNAWASHLDAICRLFEIQPEELLKHENVIVNQNQQGGRGGNGIYIKHKNVPEKLIAQYESRIKHLEEEVRFLREQLGQ